MTYSRNIDQMKIEVAKHIAADAVIQREYWNGHQGCFIGCLTHGDQASRITERFGMPEPLVKICENIFESLPQDKAVTFFQEIPDAIARDGKDLSRIHWHFHASELRALAAVDEKTQKVIDSVIDGMDRLAQGLPWPTAARAARAAADAYAAARAAAAAAADAAAYVSARERQRQTVLSLLREAV